MPPLEPARLVVDTNVWLDRFVFDDPRVLPLAAAIDAGRVVVLATAPMLDELDGVLARPAFDVDPTRRDACLARLRATVSLCAAAPDCRLPCTDPADRMFVDLAVAQRADWLVSRDKALLRLRRAALRRFGVRIGTPEDWVAAGCL